jgi:hypothetical protein
MLADLRAPEHQDPGQASVPQSSGNLQSQGSQGPEEAKPVSIWPSLILLWFLPQMGVSDLCHP